MSENDMHPSYSSAFFDGDSCSAEGLDGTGYKDLDPPHLFPDGGSANGFGTSKHSSYIERPGSRTGLSGQPVTPRYPDQQSAAD